ncbi:hypothetical protein Tsubulata_026696 [Turnera subulata]|uniref:Uncharacterized protein n=1 Tax=Turnera subulata TaxID=218843 RepID=A0A9Q0GIL6_9ROSI|nr:hypothetical protein Tsubulata_026696 [Turnera subulata]
MSMRAFGVIVGGNDKLGRAGLRVMDKSRRNRRFYKVGFAENVLYDGLNSGQKGVDLDLCRKGVDLRKGVDQRKERWRSKQICGCAFQSKLWSISF